MKKIFVFTILAVLFLSGCGSKSSVKLTKKELNQPDKSLLYEFNFNNASKVDLSLEFWRNGEKLDEMKVPVEKDEDFELKMLAYDELSGSNEVNNQLQYNLIKLKKGVELDTFKHVFKTPDDKSVVAYAITTIDEKKLNLKEGSEYILFSKVLDLDGGVISTPEIGELVPEMEKSLMEEQTVVILRLKVE